MYMYIFLAQYKFSSKNIFEFFYLLIKAHILNFKQL